MNKNAVSLNGSWIHAMNPNYVGLYVILLKLKHTWPSGDIEAACRLTHLNTHYFQQYSFLHYSSFYFN